MFTHLFFRILANRVSISSIFIHICFFLQFSILPSLHAAAIYTPTHPDPVLEPWRWQTFPELKGKGLWCMTQDNDGNMWFGVKNGVLRYDGISWISYTSKDGLLGNWVGALLATKDGSVYAATSAGISRFKNGIWKRFFSPKNDLYLIVNNLIEAKDGSLWASTRWGALHFQEAVTTLYTSKDMSTAAKIFLPNVHLVVVPEEMTPPRPWDEGLGIRTMPTMGGSLIVTSLSPNGSAESAGLNIGDRITAINGKTEDLEGLLSRISADRFAQLIIQRHTSSEPLEVVVQNEKNNTPFHDFRISYLYEDHAQTMWFGLYDAGEIVRWDPQTKKWQIYTKANGLVLGARPTISQTKDGTLWVVTYSPNKPINKFDGTSWTQENLQDMGWGNHHLSITQTTDGTLWIGGFGRLFVNRNGHWHQYTAPEAPIPATRLWSFLEAKDGALWIAGWEQEAVRFDFDPSQWTTYENLAFQCDTPNGDLWFLSADSSIVRYTAQTWIQYGVEDGLMDTPRRIITTRQGQIWAAGSHDSTAATALFDGKTWSRQLHAKLGMSIDERVVYETQDGHLWFGNRFNQIQGRGHQGGILEFDGQVWKQYTQPEAPRTAYGIGQTKDKTLWLASPGLPHFDGQTWHTLTEPKELRSEIDVVYTASDTTLWVGTRKYGVFHHNGQTWSSYGIQDGLPDTQIRSIYQTADKTIWVNTINGICRYDGQTWTTPALPLPYEKIRDIRQSQDGTLWINNTPGKTLWMIPHSTIRYRPEKIPPQIKITSALTEVSQPGNTTISWSGADPWDITSGKDLQYAYHLNNEPWSPYAQKTSQTFLSLASGAHTFTVKARDRNFNESPDPAVIHFTVIPPVYKQPWFILLLSTLFLVIAYQTTRVIRRDRRLQKANASLIQAIAERERLDGQLRHLHYLDRLRTALNSMHLPEEIVQQAGRVLMAALSASPLSGVRLILDEKQYTFGTQEPSGQIYYERPLTWADQKRGQLIVFCNLNLSQSQERTLLDETAAQIARTLEARELEMQILQSARLVSLGEMAAGVAHELNQPLDLIATVAGDVYLRLAENLAMTPDELKSMMQDVLSMTDRMAATIDHMRVFSRDTAHEPGILFDLNDAVQSALKIIQAQFKNHAIKLILNLADELLQITGHPHQIEQVILNLLANARDALDGITDREKRMIVRTTMKTLGRDTEGFLIQNSQIQTKDRWVVLEVEDNGIGITEADCRRIFEPFFTTKEADKGTGLGLSISYAIVRNHNGNITCQSTKSEGTIFQVQLPVP